MRLTFAAFYYPEVGAGSPAQFIGLPQADASF